MSTAVQQESWSANRRAAKAAVLAARDTAEARRFLDMLGLIDGPTGREISPDDTRRYDTTFIGSAPGADPESSPTALSVAAERGDRMTTPAGLRALPAAAPPAKPTRKRQSLTDDLAELERTDPDVAAAAASYDRMVERITSKPAPAVALPQPTSEVTVPAPPATSPTPPATAIDHGTPRGYWKERSLKLPTCDACKQAISKYTADKKAERDARRWAEAQDRAEATVARIEKAVEESLPPVSPITETGPDQLAEWELELLNENGGQAVELFPEGAFTDLTSAPAVELDVWLAAAAQSPSKQVQRTARTASLALLQLQSALDDLARAERAAAPRSPVAS